MIAKHTKSEGVDYVIGFLFSHNRDRILLIRKQIAAGHPLQWMDGLLNGVGGKINPGEMPVDAMGREFEEETGMVVDPWRMFGMMFVQPTAARVYMFRAFTKDMPNHGHVQQRTNEPVDVYQIYKLNKRLDPELKTIDNLRWIIPMALDTDVVNATINIL